MTLDHAYLPIAQPLESFVPALRTTVAPAAHRYTGPLRGSYGIVTPSPTELAEWSAAIDRLGLPSSWTRLTIEAGRQHIGLVFEPEATPASAFAQDADLSFCFIDGNLPERPVGARELLDRFRSHGSSCLDDVDGRACVTLFDAVTGELVVARDPIGLGAVFLAPKREALLWATSLTGLRRVTGRRHIDLHAVDAYVASGYVPAPWTLTIGIEKLGAGELVRWQRNSPHRERYHLVTVGMHDPSLAERTELLRASLSESIERSVDDVSRTGVLLSGGVDSMLALALATRVLGEAPRSYTFRYSGYDGELNEGTTAAACAAYVGSEHSEIIVDPLEIQRMLPSLLDNFGEPFSLGIHTSMLEHIAADGVTTVLTGSSADCSGIEGQVVNAQRYLDLGPVARFGVRATTRIAKRVDDAWCRRTAGGHLGAVGDLISALHGGIYTARTARTYFVGDWANRGPVRRHLYADRTLFDRARHARHSLHESQARYLEGVPMVAATRVVDSLQFDAEIMHMWNLNATRPVGLVGHDIYAARPVLESRLRLRPQDDKPDVRQLASDLLPAELAYATKIHQAVPIAHWLRGPLRPFLGEVLDPDRLTALGLFDPTTVARMLRAHDAERVDNAWGLWTILSMTLWQEGLRKLPC